MPLMVGFPHVGRGSAAATTGYPPFAGKNSTAPRAPISSLAAQDLRGAPVIHPPDANAGSASHFRPATTRRGSLLRRCNTPPAGVSTRFALLFAAPAG